MEWLVYCISQRVGGGGDDSSLSGFSGGNFSGACMRNFDLTACRFSGAVLSDAALSCANLSGGDFTAASFRSARLWRCYAQRAVLIDADFRDADLCGMYARLAACCGAVFAGVNVSGTTFPEWAAVLYQQFVC